ncbi:hypothetical protein [Pantoea agglomerans]|uniref:hypothetical protein n=1 Tax=Enterobacter agglomerans TaxID=549 RepID=UPI001F36D690|nr:hypothetical protein [Pantoea agglomerans]UJL36111.1 hypothetical protein JK642_13270 [Pantoea agglomerans]
MKTLAIIKDNIVIDTILVDDDMSDWTAPDDTIFVDVTDKNVGVGFVYVKDKKTFTNPAVDNHVDK